MSYVYSVESVLFGCLNNISFKRGRLNPIYRNIRHHFFTVGYRFQIETDNNHLILLATFLYSLFYKWNDFTGVFNFNKQALALRNRCNNLFQERDFFTFIFFTLETAYIYFTEFFRGRFFNL